MSEDRLEIVGMEIDTQNYSVAEDGVLEYDVKIDFVLAPKRKLAIIENKITIKPSSFFEED